MDDAHGPERARVPRLGPVPISMRCARHTPPAHDAPEHDTSTVRAPVDPCEQVIDEEIDDLDDLDDLIQLDRELHVTDEVPPASDTIDPSSDTGPLRQQVIHDGGEATGEESTADEDADGLGEWGAWVREATPRDWMDFVSCLRLDSVLSTQEAHRDEENRMDDRARHE